MPHLQHVHGDDNSAVESLGCCAAVSREVLRLELERDIVGLRLKVVGREAATL